MGYTEESLAAELRQEDLQNRCVFVTGGNSGFGYMASRILLKAKASVIIGCRNLEHAERACETLKQESGSDRISYVLIDLTDPESIRRCVDEIQSKQLHIQVLVNNAGVSMVHTYTEAPTGVELTCQTNYIGVVELTDRMIPLLLREENPRCVFVSSYTYTKNPVQIVDAKHLWVHKTDYERFASYFRSKYLVTSYALYLARHQPSLKTVICDPGVAATHIARELGCVGKLYALPFFQLFAPTAKGACTIAFAAASGQVDAMESGVMLKNCGKKELIERIRDEGEQEAIRKVTVDVIRSFEWRVCCTRFPEWTFQSRWL